MKNNSVTLHEREVKRLLRVGGLADPFFLNYYSLAPYSSCQHGCVYCDGRAEKYHLEGEFDRDITFRHNSVTLLKKELPKLREIAPISIGSGITDVYQPIEAEIGVMREMATYLNTTPYPISILTKSSLIQRDLDLWSELNRKNGFHLQVSLTTLDEKVREIFEPEASPVEERLETIRLFKEAGCAVGVFMMPLLPGITDTEESISSLLEKLKELEVDYVMPGFLTLRPGRQKEFYMQIIGKYYPHLTAHYEELYRKPLISGSPSYEYRTRYKSRYDHLYEGINMEPPHRLYRNSMPLYQELHLLLSHMKSLYRRKGVDISALQSAYDSYIEWVEAERKVFNRRRSLPPNTIDERLSFLLRCGGFEEIIANEKLQQFIYDVVINRKTFDYHDLTLQESAD